jgi:magnesium transporter
VLTAYIIEGRRLRRLPQPVGLEALRGAVWIDLLRPATEEIRLVEDTTGLQVASETALAEIEPSSRLQYDGEALYLGALLLSEGIATSPIGFALTPEYLLTMRFAESEVVEALPERLSNPESIGRGASHVFVTLVEALVGRLADLLEGTAAELGAAHPTGADRGMLDMVGRAGALVASIQETLLSMSRIVPYVEQNVRWLPAELHPRLAAVRQDVAALMEYQALVANKVRFILDTVLALTVTGLNERARIFAAAAIVGIPPALVAIIVALAMRPGGAWYGLLAVAVSAIVPLVFIYLRGLP